jgi:hypothetical protein
MLICMLSLAALQPADAADAADEARLSRSGTELVKAEQQRFGAQIANDGAALKLALADELIYTHASGKVQTKAEYLHDLAAGSTHYLGIDVTGRVVHVWGNTGLTHGTITLTVGTDRKLVSRYTGVYVRRAGRWQLVAWQATDIRT